MPRTMMGPCALFLLSTVTARADDHARHPRRPATVYTITNDADANRVLAFELQQGRLGEPVAYATQGRGSGDSLGSQGALVLSDDRRFLLAVNAGSNELSVFAVDGRARLELRERVQTGGTRPAKSKGSGLGPARMFACMHACVHTFCTCNRAGPGHHGYQDDLH